MRYLIKANVQNIGDNWVLSPLNAKRGEPKLKLTLTQLDFCTLLRKIKATDDASQPRTKRVLTYPELMGEIVSKRDTIIYIWNTFYPMSDYVATELAIN